MPNTTTLSPLEPTSSAPSSPTDLIAGSTGTAAGSTGVAAPSSDAVATSIQATEAPAGATETAAPVGTGEASLEPGTNNSTSETTKPDETKATPATTPGAGTIDDPIAPPACEEASLDLTITDRYGHPIPNLAFKVLVLKKDIFKGATNAKGKIPTIRNLPLGCRFDIWIKKDEDTPDSKRDDADGYKYAATGTAHTDETYACLKSPRTRFEFTTEAHLGTPGQAAKHKEAVIQSHNQKPAPAPQITGNVDKKPEIKPGRDENGLPKAAVVDGQTDWYDRNAKNAGAPEATKEELAHVNEVIRFGMAQALLVYPDITSASIIGSMIAKKFTQPSTTKLISASVQRCNRYVKVALWEAGYGPPNEEIGLNISPAKDMGPWLVKAGFRDVTSEVPDGRWAAPGDVIVYKWTDSEWEKRKKRSPGIGNIGHIDIRTYDGYLSDFFQDHLPDSKKFEVTGIYRKYSDPLPVARTRAFLKLIREWECHGISDDSQRYLALQKRVGDRQQPFFSDTSTHPFSKKPNEIGSFSGAYQIKYSTWQELVSHGMPSNFTPESQDRFAVAKIDERKALGLIRQGKIREAITDTNLRKEWSSLVIGARKDKTLDDMIESYDQFLRELMKK